MQIEITVYKNDEYTYKVEFKYCPVGKEPIYYKCEQFANCHRLDLIELQKFLDLCHEDYVAETNKLLLELEKDNDSLKKQFNELAKRLEISKTEGKRLFDEIDKIGSINQVLCKENKKLLEEKENLIGEIYNSKAENATLKLKMEKWKMENELGNTKARLKSSFEDNEALKIELSAAKANLKSRVDRIEYLDKYSDNLIERLRDKENENYWMQGISGVLLAFLFISVIFGYCEIRERNQQMDTLKSRAVEMGHAEFKPVNENSNKFMYKGEK